MPQQVFAAAIAALIFCAPAYAAKITINQTKANNGGVTAGDSVGFPISINTAGSYILDGNLTVPAGKNGIVINVDNVTIDLDGFRIFGNGTGSRGIHTSKSFVTIRNGTIQKFASHGIFATGDYLTVQNMTVAQNTGYGIYGFPSTYARILNNTLAGNGAYGLRCGFSCLVESNIVSDNDYGVMLESGHLIGNTIISNNQLAIRSDNRNDVGFVGNTIVDNNETEDFQATGILPAYPNHCYPSFCEQEPGG